MTQTSLIFFAILLRVAELAAMLSSIMSICLNRRPWENLQTNLKINVYVGLYPKSLTKHSMHYFAYCIFYSNYKENGSEPIWYMLLLLLLAYLYMNCIQLLKDTFEWLKIDLRLTEICFALCPVCRQILFIKNSNINNIISVLEKNTTTHISTHSQRCKLVYIYLFKYIFHTKHIDLQLASSSSVSWRVSCLMSHVSCCRLKLNVSVWLASLHSV